MTTSLPGTAPSSAPLVRIRLHGELDITTRDATFRACTAVAGAAVTVDLVDVTFLDSAGALALLRARDHLERDGGALLLTGATGEPARLLTLLDEIGEQAIRELDQEFWGHV